MLDEKDGYKEVQLGPRKLKIPHNWEKTKIGKLAKYLNGYGFSSSDWSNKGLPIIRIQNLTNSTGKEINYYNGELEDRYIVENGDLLVSWSATLGVFKWQGQKAALNQHIFKVNPKEIVDEDFLYFLLDHNLGVLERKIHGTTMKHITKSTFENTFVSLPPFPEQKKIAEVLSMVDEAIQKTEEIIERSKELKKGLMQDLLTKGIDHEEFKEVQLGPKSITIPSDWAVERSKNLFDIKKESVDPQTLDEPVVELYSMPAFDEGSEPKRTKPSQIGSNKYIVPKDTLLFPKLNIRKQRFWRVNRDSDLRGICSTEYWPLIPKRKLDLDFYNYYFRTYEFNSNPKISSSSSTNSHKRVKQSSFQKVILPFPSYIEQKKISKILSTVDKKIQQEQDYKEKLEKLKKGLMQDLLTGKVRVLPLLSEEEKEELEKANVPG